jgi:uncharacterized membrane protein
MLFNFVKRIFMDGLKIVGAFIATIIFSASAASLFFAFAGGVGYSIHLIPFCHRFFNEKDLISSCIFDGLCVIAATVLAYIVVEYLIKTWKEMSLLK